MHPVQGRGRGRPGPPIVLAGTHHGLWSSCIDLSGQHTGGGCHTQFSDKINDVHYLRTSLPTSLQENNPIILHFGNQFWWQAILTRPIIGRQLLEVWGQLIIHWTQGSLIGQVKAHEKDWKLIDCSYIHRRFWKHLEAFGSHWALKESESDKIISIRSCTSIKTQMLSWISWDWSFLGWVGVASAMRRDTTQTPRPGNTPNFKLPARPSKSRFSNLL